MQPSHSNLGERITAPAEMLEPAIAEMLSRIPETWQAYRPDDLTEIQSQTLFLLTAARMVERREGLRLRMVNHPVFMEATFTATGEYGGVQALLPLAASTWTEWQEAYRQWMKSDNADVPPMHCERLEPSEWRLTDQGILARKYLTEGEEGRVRDFVLKRGNFQNRPPERGVGALVRMEKIKAEPAAPVMVNIGNWDKGGEAIAQALNKMFAQKATVESGAVAPEAARPEGATSPGGAAQSVATSANAAATPAISVIKSGNGDVNIAVAGRDMNPQELPRRRQAGRVERFCKKYKWVGAILVGAAVVVATAVEVIKLLRGG